MITPSELLIPATRATLANGEKIFGDIPPGLFAHKPTNPAGEIIRVNHPAFQIGHLSLYFSLMAEMGGQPDRVPQAPTGYRELFRKGVECLHDPDGKIYPSKEAILEYFRSASQAFIGFLPEIPATRYQDPLEDPDRRERFKSVGAFFAYLLLSHTSHHFGQIHVWRRIMELP